MVQRFAQQYSLKYLHVLQVLQPHPAGVFPSCFRSVKGQQAGEIDSWHYTRIFRYHPTTSCRSFVEAAPRYGSSNFDYMSRKEIIKVPAGSGANAVVSLPGFEPPQDELALPAFEERWTGGYIFENEWQSFRTRQNRDLELTTAQHAYDRPGRYTVAVKVIDIFGNDTMTLVPVNVG